VFAAARDVTKQNQAQRTIAQQQTAALDRLAELEQFRRLAVGRELKMVEVKKQNEYLRKFAPQTKPNQATRTKGSQAPNVTTTQPMVGPSPQ
jgi:hypothetical protein